VSHYDDDDDDILLDEEAPWRNLPAATDPQTKKVQEVMHAQHALHGVLADVWAELGGPAFVKEWAREQPGQFISMMVRLTPSMIPQHGIQGDVNIVVNNIFKPTELDRVTLDEQGRVIEQ